ncbi:MAG: hypothetical protein V1848_01705 [Candidatus Magasanikbacteria bacterium]
MLKDIYHIVTGPDTQQITRARRVKRIPIQVTFTAEHIDHRQSVTVTGTVKDYKKLDRLATWDLTLLTSKGESVEIQYYCTRPGKSGFNGRLIM